MSYFTKISSILSDTGRVTPSIVDNILSYIQFKILVTGDRYFTHDQVINTVLNNAVSSYGRFSLILGDARGADKLAHLWARDNNISCTIYYADWSKYGKAAGPLRNQLMIKQEPDLVLAFHDDIKSSKGTLNCVTLALNQNIEVFLYGSAGRII